MRPTLTNDYWSKSDAALHYIRRDANEAAHPAAQYDRIAEDKYLEQINDAATVLAYRKREQQR